MTWKGGVQTQRISGHSYPRQPYLKWDTWIVYVSGGAQQEKHGIQT